MKKVCFFVLCFFITCSISSQTTNEYEYIVQAAIEAINTKDVEKLLPHLSENFTISGQKGDIAQMVLKQITTQLNDSILTIKKTDSNQTEKGFEIEYNFEYKNLGTKEAYFIFDSANKIVEFAPFKMEVKTLNNNDARIEKPSQSIIEIPFSVSNNLILVDVELNGSTRKFFFDSGAPQVIINSKYFAEVDTNTITSGKAVGGSISGANIFEIKSIGFYGIKLSNQDVMTMDLSHLEEAVDAEIYGLIGYDIIKDYDVMFDYSTNKITLINPEKSDFYLNSKVQRVPFELKGHIPVIEVFIGDDKVLLGIDSGASANLIDKQLFDKFRKSTRKKKTTELKGAGKQIQKVKTAKIKTTVIGNKKFKNINTAFSDISHLNRDTDLIKYDGLLGYEILSKQRMVISYARKELIFLD